MSLSEDERRELERLRRSHRRHRASDALDMSFWRGVGFMCLFGWVIPYFISSGVIYVVGSLVCIFLGILSNYYGPFKHKKEAED